jgi:hypothetical protein
VKGENAASEGENAASEGKGEEKVLRYGCRQKQETFKGKKRPQEEDVLSPNLGTNGLTTGSFI